MYPGQFSSSNEMKQMLLPPVGLSGTVYGLFRGNAQHLTLTYAIRSSVQKLDILFKLVP